VDFGAGVEGCELALMQGEVGRGVVAEVDGGCTVASELMGCGAANADGRVCAWGRLGSDKWWCGECV
jgi:hypothetical protein